MADLADLERRVIALEAANNENTKALNWGVGTLGRLAADVSVVKDDVKELRSEMREVKSDLKGLRTDLPSMLAAAVREGMKGR